MSNKTSNIFGFILIVFFHYYYYLFSYHWVNLLFGDNSLQVYSSLKHKKEYLRREILRLQKENAYLQKEYFELKNLEPEE
jgi:cell division protein FtsB